MTEIFLAIASRACGGQNNTVAICSPSSDSIWTNDTDQEITWKYNNPVFTEYDTLDLYLLYQPNDSAWEAVLEWTGLDKTKGVMITHVNDSWYPAPIANNAPNVTWTMYLYLVGSGYDYQSDLALISSRHNFFPVPQSFTLIQTSINTTSTNTTATPSNTTTTNPTSEASTTPSVKKSSSKLAGWAIAVICIAALFFIAAVAALIWAYRRYKQRKNRKTPLSNNTAAALGAASAGFLAANGSMHSSTQHLVSSRSPRQQDEVSSFATTSEKPPLGLHSEAHHSSSILSSTDALMIADTFRQFMRKPEWNEEMELNAQRQQIEEKGESGEEERKGSGDASVEKGRNTRIQ
ncbi:uncharacterized protein B0P05DRAFT_559973 [Gilbertella persicaria]|uniref:uncharacterized protein n=1 Tax=Gilbertella persicaria TaxID=101096 RepID=UPI00221F28C5|nr:uncharacterized protein B0P05DRAFT_559973 [Gilbertella persicaria]KAI8056511.1 hypothetical protein B0P05DRAFT_559973 [Gilbertella persicaria]